MGPRRGGDPFFTADQARQHGVQAADAFVRGVSHLPYDYSGGILDLLNMAGNAVLPGDPLYTGLRQDMVDRGAELGVTRPMPTAPGTMPFYHMGAAADFAGPGATKIMNRGMDMIDGSLIPYLKTQGQTVANQPLMQDSVLPFLKDETGSLRLVGTRDPDIDANAQWLPNSRGQASLYDMIGTAGLAGSTSKKLTRLAHESPQAFLDELSFLVDNSTQDAVRSSIVGGDDAFQHEFYNKRAQRYSQLEADALALISKDNPQFAARYAKDNWRTRQAARVDEDLAMRAERPGETEGGALSRGGVQTWDTPNAYSVEQFEKIRDYLSGMGATIKGKGEIYKALIDFEGPKTPHRILARLKEHADDVPDELYGEMMQAINKMQNKALPDVTDVGSLSNPATFGRGVEKVGGENPRVEELAMAEDSVFKYAEPGKPSTGYRQPRTLEEMRELPAEGGGPARVGDVFNDGVTNWRVEEATPAGRLVAKNMTTGENTFGWEPAGMERVPGGKVVAGGREARTLEEMRAQTDAGKGVNHLSDDELIGRPIEIYGDDLANKMNPYVVRVTENPRRIVVRFNDPDIQQGEYPFHPDDIVMPGGSNPPAAHGPGSIFDTHKPTMYGQTPEEQAKFFQDNRELHRGSAYQEPKQYTDSVFGTEEYMIRPDRSTHSRYGPGVSWWESTRRPVTTGQGSAYDEPSTYTSSIFGDQQRAEDLPRKTGARPKDVLNAIKKEPKGSLLPPETPGRMSKAESEALGYWHPIGAGKRLQKPVHAMSLEVGDLPIQPERPADLESMQGGVMLPAMGDRTDAGKILTKVGEVPLENPVRLEGGPGFMRDNPESAWAAHPREVGSYLKKARPYIERGQDVYMGYVPMSHDTANFNMMKTDAVLEQIRSANHYKKTIKAFDKRIRQERPEWAGLNDEDALRQLHENGALRHVFNRVAGMKEFQQAGFPDMGETRFAITQPSLIDVPLGHGGQTFGRITGNIVDNPIQPHKTYGQQMEGEYMGGIEHGIPRKLLFPEFYRQRRAAGKKVGGDARSMERSKPVQELDQEWLDNIIDYLMKHKGYTAAAAAAIAPQIYEDQVAREEIH